MYTFWRIFGRFGVDFRPRTRQNVVTAHCNPLGAPSIWLIWHIWVPKKATPILTFRALLMDSQECAHTQKHVRSVQKRSCLMFHRLSALFVGFVPPPLFDFGSKTRGSQTPGSQQGGPPTFYLLLGLGRSVCRAPHEHAFGSEEL